MADRYPLRIGVAEFFHETNVFAARPTTIDAFRAFRLFHRDELVVADSGTRTFTAGMLDQLRDRGHLAVPLLAAAALPSGVIEASTFEALMSELIRLTGTGNIDGLCIALHGAATADGFDDADGEALRRLRSSVGPSIPIVATLDLHGNITSSMVAHADLMLGTNYYPHTDCYERGREAVDSIVAILSDQLHPVPHLERIPMMIAPSTTDHDPARSLLERSLDWESKPGVIEVQVFHGFPMTDSPHVGVSVLAYSESTAALAAAAASDVAGAAWATRHQFLTPSLSPEEALDEAMALVPAGGPVVINECSDNAGGGTPGDGTHLLRAMIEASPSRTVFGTIADPETARQAHDAGIGATINVRLGARVDPLYGRPIEAMAEVRGLSDGVYVSRSSIWGPMTMRLGPSACLRIGAVDVIVVSVAMQVYDDGPFEVCGVDVNKAEIVGLKSSQHFRAWWRDVAAAIITTDPPGGTSNQIHRLGHKRVRRPIWPLDANAAYTSAAE